MYDGTPCVVTPGSVNRQGYRTCGVRRLGVVVWTRHRLAWIDHHGMLPPPETPFVLHHCDNPPCENALHLYAGTNADNMRDRIAHGRMIDGHRGLRRGGGPGGDRTRFRNRVPGEGRVNHKLTDERVREARREHAAGRSMSSLAQRYDVAPQTLRAAIERRTWRHVE